jgi:TatD DNase family protein
LELVNQYPNEFDAEIPYFSVGIHPWHLKETNLDAELSIVEKQLQNPKCLALGECGLDKRIEISLDLQIEVFKKQLLLAQQYSKPVIIHYVAAFQEIIEIKKELQISVPMVIHGFSKNIQTAKSLTDNGFYISFGKYLIQNPDLKKVFTEIPNDKFFLETDTIQNGIAAVYELAAKYKNISELELHQIIDQNFQKVFNKQLN